VVVGPSCYPSQPLHSRSDPREHPWQFAPGAMTTGMEVPVIATRYESVAGVRNLYIDHRRAGSPYVLRWKENGKTNEIVLGVVKLKTAILERDKHFALPTEDRERGGTEKCQAAFDAWIAAGVKTRGKGKLSKSAKKLYSGLWRNHVVGEKDLLGKLKVRDVTVAHIIAVLDRMEAKGLATNNMYVMLSSFFSAMTMEPYNYRQTNPVRRLGTKKPAAPDTDAISEDAVMTREEIDTIVASLASRRGGCGVIERHTREMVIRTAYHTGLRLSEVLGLTWDAIDLEAGEVDVKKQLEVDFVAGDSSTWFTNVKGNKTRVNNVARIVPLDDEAWAMLREYRQWVFANGLWTGPGGLVFPTKKHTPLGQNTISEAFTKAVEASGLTRYGWTFHMLRHSFASLIFHEGGSIEEVAQLLGNSVEVARSRYIHLQKRDLYNEAFRARRRAAATG
jgi:integrase